MTVQADMSVNLDKARSKLLEAKKRIQWLEEVLEDEKIQKKKKLYDLEEKMKVELDDIDCRVKQSFKSLVEKKNTEIKKAIERAVKAEASAKATESVLSELKSSVLSTAEATSEG